MLFKIKVSKLKYIVFLLMTLISCKQKNLKYPFEYEVNNQIEKKLTIKDVSLLNRLEDRFNFQLRKYNIDKYDECKYQKYIYFIRKNGCAKSPIFEKEDLKLLEDLKQVGLNISDELNFSFIYNTTRDVIDRNINEIKLIKNYEKNLAYNFGAYPATEDNVNITSVLDGLLENYNCDDYNKNPLIRKLVLLYIFLNMEYNNYAIPKN